jgi:hypothetical protein
MKNRLLEKWENNPLQLILVAAALLRLLAAIFSKGFGMHDDHFLVLEPAQSWVDGYDYNRWLPGGKSDAVPSGHSFFYAGIHYLILLFFKSAGIIDPQMKMFIIRLLHGAFSLITVYFGYKIARLMTDKNTAAVTGLILTVLWFFPMLSVRNLVEVVCIPFLIYGTWIVLKNLKNPKPWLSYLTAGLIIGLAFSVRFQILFFAFGLGLALLLKGNWKESLVFGAGFFLSAGLVQGSLDYFVWGKPFMEFREYVRYNIEASGSYIANAWYTYILLLLGILIPPVSLFIFFGFFRYWRKHLILFLPAFIFFLFHSLFPNKQERFILPVVPFIIISGIAGWQQFVSGRTWFVRHKKVISITWIFFWVLNMVLLFPVTVMYSKKARVESMTYLSRYPEIKTILIENSNRGEVQMTPIFYLGQRVYDFGVTDKSGPEMLPQHARTNPRHQPRFFLFFETQNLEMRVENMRKVFPNIEYETTIEPGMIDRILCWLNPVNRNQTIVVYRNRDFYPQKL